MTIAPSKSDARKGFTLIELLVVIAIIGILSSVVLASLNTARSKGTDAKIQSELRSIAVNAEIYYDNFGNSYGTAANTSCTAGMFAQASNPNIDQIVDDLTAATTLYDPICNSAAGTFMIAHRLTSPTAALFFCVDNTGKATTTSTTITNALTACP